jgi:D-lactate dehydrogenase
MKVAFFSAKAYDRASFAAVNTKFGHELVFLEPQLNGQTATLAAGSSGVCAFVNDHLDTATLEVLAKVGVRLIALRSAGFNNVDLARAEQLGLVVARVPAYSPYAVAEHAVALVLALDRKLPRAYARVRDGNFALDGLCGFDVHGRTVGIIGTGRIGAIFARIMNGLGCRILAFDRHPNSDCVALGPPGVEYAELPRLFAESDIISLHAPLTPETLHIIDADAIRRMKRGVMIINTGRGGLVDTKAVIDGLKSGHIGFLGLDVYEEEEELFFVDRSGQIIQDDVFMRLLSFPNVIVTAHQAFFTEEALHNIAETTLANVTAFETSTGTLHRVSLDS